ncbi:ribulose-phosphate 3-epimerase [Beduini massiliensis]|uniref:ribulose-phosphate 3-epimerase n=1 Tax=Beduini massiliensis TaxID=1585974 RepID=UPI00059A8350|nr:ribulose-phosphate 3-epimerase [Beduini massiliensis]
MIISPSVLSANFADLKTDIKKIEEGGASWLHYDVMDGHFVPNISFGYSILGDVRKVTDLFLDVHLMISDPKKYLNDFIKAGADLITFHYESCDDLDQVKSVITEIKNQGIKAGISIKPNTDVEAIKPVLADLDLVLVMSVEPGFGGQSFMPKAIDKIKTLRNWIDQGKMECLIEVDGGINEETGKQCKEAGADVLVAGSYIFKHENTKEAIESLK